MECAKRVIMLFLLFCIFSYPFEVYGSEKIPPSVVDISKDNTYPNATQNVPRLQPSELAKRLVESSPVPIENPDLIRMLNETSIANAPLAVGYKARIYLGQWPLQYESSETVVNWEYQQVNKNYMDNRGNGAFVQMVYHQDQQKVIRGGLTANVKNADEVKKMMMLKAMDKTHLPLAFQTIVGYGTKHSRVYNLSPNNIGYLYAYVPAVSEKGKITYGEVYLVLKGNQHKLDIENVTSQGIGAWIPIQDRLSFGFLATPKPR
ncbi:YfkD family protein [Ectobacillus polymachus]|uniref:YfkD family protein n=1 Tax=Ectobacillus polymachus TaxID=1508806 RepID=UPI003A83510C